MTSARENLLGILAELGIKHEVESVETPEGAKADVIFIHHGEWLLVAGAKEKRAKLVLDLPIDEAPARALEGLPPEKRARFLATIRREMLDGRTGFNIRWKDAAAQRGLENIRLEQDLAIGEINPGTIQRFIDAKQELVTIAVRVQQVWVLSFAEFASVKEQAVTLDSGAGKLDDAMYH